MLNHRSSLPYVINEGYLDLLLSRTLDDCVYNIRIKPNFNTAAWCMKNNQHYIIIGDAILTSQNLTVDYARYHPYIHSYLYHEVGHALFTERDLKAINIALKAENIPFSLLNLFEDARIEELIRKKTKRAFSWSNYENINPPKSQTDLLFCIIQHDGKGTTYKDFPQYDRIYNYYYVKIITMKNTWELIPLLKEWVNEFGAQNSSDTTDDKKNAACMEDLSFSMQLNDSKEEAEVFLDDTKNTHNILDEPSAIDNDIEGDSVSIQDYTTETVRIFGIKGYYDKDMAKNLAPQFLKLFRKKRGFQNTSSPSKQLNLRGICRNDFRKPFRNRNEISRATKHVTIIVDCSGSMSSIMPKIRVILAIFSELSKYGHIKGHVVLSAIDDYTAKVETLELPLSEQTISEIHGTYDAEGLDNTMRVSLPLMQQSDWNICLTDGMICDDKIDKKYFNSKRIFTYGIYIGEEDSNMSNWFDYHIVEPDVEEVVDKMLRLLK